MGQDIPLGPLMVLFLFFKDAKISSYMIGGEYNDKNRN